MPNQNPARTRRFQCRHIFTDGHRCGSPCLRHEEFCYYHHSTRRPVPNTRNFKLEGVRFELPFPEDRAAIQRAIGEVLLRVAAYEIDERRAGLLLYGLQIASANLPKTTPKPEQPVAPVEHVVVHPILGRLAPRTALDQQEPVDEAEAGIASQIQAVAAPSSETTEAPAVSPSTEPEPPRKKFTPAEVREMYRRQASECRPRLPRLEKTNLPIPQSKSRRRRANRYSEDEFMLLYRTACEDSMCRPLSLSTPEEYATENS